MSGHYREVCKHVVLVVLTTAIAVLYVRVLRLEDHAIEARDEIAALVHGDIKPATIVDLEPLRVDLAKAIARTEYLYVVLDTVVHEASGWISDRVTLPHAPLGWSSLFVVREPSSWRRLTKREEHP